MKIKTVLSTMILMAVTSSCGQNTMRDKNLIYRGGKIDFIESYLNLCLLVDSTIDKAAYYKEIDELCKEVEKEIEGYKSPQALIEGINNYLFYKKKFKYNSDANKYFFGTESEKEEVIKKGVNKKEFISMQGVLKNKEGICSSLSMLYLTITYELGLPIFGVVVPGHEFVRYNDGKIKINIETTDKGKEYSDNYYRENYIRKNKGDIFLKDLNCEQTIGVYLNGIGNALSKYNESVECYDLAIEINPEYAEAYYNRGLAKAIQQHYNEAIADYTTAIEINPKYADAYYNRGLTKFHLQCYKEAIADYTTAIENNPKLADSYSARGLAKANQQHYNEAIDDYNKAIEINPKYADAYYNRGLAKFHLQCYKEAIVDFTTAIEINPELAVAYFDRGLVKANQQHYKEAIVDFTTAIEINPEYADAYYYRGLAKANQQHYNEAIADYTTAIEINPEFALAYCNRGVAKIALGQKDSGCLDLSKTLELGFAKANEIIEEYCH
jgi:tetratricopeptide (TPR) repeat protein